MKCNLFARHPPQQCQLDLFIYIRYHAHGILVLTEQHINPNYAKVYFDGINTTRDVAVDNLEVKLAPQDCSELILNPSIVDSSYWSYDERGRSKVDLVPGPNEGSDLALRSFARDHVRRGFQQQLDTRCFVSGAEYEISAKFRLLNSTSLDGVICDTNSQESNRYKTQCPSVTIFGSGCNKHPVTNDTSM
jgi:hypothetical protein